VVVDSDKRASLLACGVNYRCKKVCGGGSEADYPAKGEAMLQFLCPNISFFSTTILKMLTSGLFYKGFTIVIYDRNGNGLYYTTMFLTNSVLARSVDYDSKVALQKIAYLFYDHKFLNHASRPLTMFII
jgi:hypothetical protein